MKTIIILVAVALAGCGAFEAPDESAKIEADALRDLNSPALREHLCAIGADTPECPCAPLKGFVCISSTQRRA